MAAATKAMILKIIVHCQYRVTRTASFDHLVGVTSDRVLNFVH
jgi:hypothetical protein